ncbi:MAG: glycosyltransferase family 2 protein [Rectinema sp.]|nr:glycosyltransferase family 2 protein [Rectinema sp.]
MNTLLLAYGWVAAAASVFSLLVTVANIVYLAFENAVGSRVTGPRVSVLVPARNEEHRIKPCLDSLLDQDYSNYQIFVIDDNSTDGTWKILREYAQRHPRKVRIFKASPLPDGWYGKPHALQELSAHADGTYLLCTDADTVHHKSSIGRAVAIAEASHADLVSGYVHHLMPTFGEAAIEPSIYLLTILGVPLILIPSTRSPLFCHAIGQFMMFRRSFFEQMGGYEPVRHQATEDVRMARQVKARGGKVLFVDLKDYVECRMYEDFPSAKKGIAKNAYDYLGKSNLALIAGTIAVPLIYFIPLIVLFVNIPWFGPALPFLKASAVLTMYTWILTTIDRRLPAYVPFIYPLVLTNTLSALWRGFRAVRKEGGVDWKGRKVV